MSGQCRADKAVWMAWNGECRVYGADGVDSEEWVVLVGRAVCRGRAEGMVWGGKQAASSLRAQFPTQSGRATGRGGALTARATQTTPDSAT